jgi:hypothetical protein
MTTMYRPDTPEEVETRNRRRQWEAAGSPGYRPESQRHTWESLRRLPSATAVDPSGSIGRNWSSDPAMQEWQGAENRNRDASEAAFRQWMQGQNNTGGRQQPSGSPNRPPVGTPEAGARPAGPPRPGQAQQPRPGQAQSQQPQPQGTPYNPQQGGNFSAYSPQQGSSGYGPQQGGGFSAWDPNIANNAQAPRPPAFQAFYGQLGGGYSDQPNTPTRDAFISQVNNQLGQMQAQSWQQPGMGAPQFDFARMFGQAGDMVQQGYQNPFQRR